LGCIIKAQDKERSVKQMKINKKLMIAIPVAAGVLALASGVGIASAKGADQAANTRNAANYATAPDASSATNPGPAVYCGNYGMNGWANGQGMVTPQVASLLGTTVADLQSQLNSGKTMMEIASAKGVGQDQLIQTMMAPFKDQMGLMLKYGYLTQDQVNNMTAQMQQRLQTMVTSKINSGNGYGWGYMMQGYRGGMMGGWANGQSQPGSTAAPQTPAPRSGFGGMMGRW
jgi:hypothetical protein